MIVKVSRLFFGLNVFFVPKLFLKVVFYPSNKVYIYLFVYFCVNYVNYYIHRITVNVILQYIAELFFVIKNIPGTVG